MRGTCSREGAERPACEAWRFPATSLSHNGEDLTDDRWRDLPAEWWLNAGANQQNGVTSEDLAGFRNLPAQIQRAAQAGTANGVSGIRVNLDGRAVGELVAPYVSRAIARDLIM